MSKEERGQAFVEAILLSEKDTEIEILYESEISWERDNSKWREKIEKQNRLTRLFLLTYPFK